MKDYKPIIALVKPAYSYVEGDDKEHYWLDSQSCFYYMIYEETDENTFQRHDGKKYWIIEPYIPKDITISDKNFKDVEPLIKWFVTDTSEECDEGKEWNFEKHNVKHFI